MGAEDERERVARLAGLLYLACIAAGMFSLLYVPSRINVTGNAAATVANIAAFEPLFRLGICVGLIGFALFVVLPFVLYRLLSPVNGNVAVLMVVLGVIYLPVDFVAIVDQLNVLSLMGDASYRDAFTPEQRLGQAMLFLDAYRNGILVSEIFWGLWLLPFGYLVFKSGFLPKVLGVLLMLGCAGYLVTVFGELLLPGYAVPGFVRTPAALGEIGTCLWLLIVGAARTPEVPASTR